MKPGISTHVFLQQRLGPGLLDALRDGGAQTIEVFAARHHFDYTDRLAVRETADWFRSTGIGATLHQPLYADAHWSRHVAPTVNLIDVEKSRRIDAMDEVKRALEAAEQVPFTALVLHLGQKDDRWSPRSIENSLTAIEHLKAFAHPLGVKILLENLRNEVTTPERLLEIVKIGHFDSVGICLDVGHAHLGGGEAGIAAAIEICGPRLAQLHLHDNRGERDDHLWPGSGTIDWNAIARSAALLKPAIGGILEIGYEQNEAPEAVTRKARQFFDTQLRFAEEWAQSPQPA